MADDRDKTELLKPLPFSRLPGRGQAGGGSPVAEFHRSL